MIELLTVLIALIGGLVIGYFLGWNHADIVDKIEALYLTEPDAGVVEPKSPEMSVTTSEVSSVISPKTPDQIEREAELALRKRNGL